MENILKFDKEPVVELKTEFVKSKSFYKTNVKDDWFEELKKYYLNTATHSALVNNTHRLLAGYGLDSDIDTEKLKIKNLKINDVLWDFWFDYALYGVGCLDIQWNIEHTNILKIDYIDPTKLRIGYVDPYNYELKTLWYKTDWVNYQRKQTTQLQAWSETGTENRQILYFTSTPRSLSIYPVPMYIGSLKSVKTEMNIMDYYENLSSNGFMGNILINFNDGDPGDEVKVETARELKKFLGPNAESLAMVQWNKSTENAATIEKFNTEAEDQKFLNLINEYKANEITSHGASPSLAGLEIPGKLGDRNAIEEQYEKFLNEHIYTIREKFLNIFEEINKYLETPLNNYRFDDMKLFKDKQEIENNTI